MDGVLISKPNGQGLLVSIHGKEKIDDAAFAKQVYNQMKITSCKKRMKILTNITLQPANNTILKICQKKA